MDTVSSRERGYSLLEAVVALALVVVLFLLAGRLLVASRRMESSSASVAAGPRLGVLGVQLRRDLESATLVSGSGGLWSSVALDVVLQDGTVVRYDFDGENLTRSVVAGGVAGRPKVVVRGLRSFRWRNLAHRAVDVKVSFPLTTLSERRPARPSSLPDSTWWIRVALRGSGWARRW